MNKKEDIKIGYVWKWQPKTAVYGNVIFFFYVYGINDSKILYSFFYDRKVKFESFIAYFLKEYEFYGTENDMTIKEIVE